MTMTINKNPQAGTLPVVPFDTQSSLKFQHFFIFKDDRLHSLKKSAFCLKMSYFMNIIWEPPSPPWRLAHNRFKVSVLYFLG